MPKIYIVTFGEYDDFGIDSAWSTKELAEKRINSDKIPYPEPHEIEEWEVDQWENL